VNKHFVQKIFDHPLVAVVTRLSKKLKVGTGIAHLCYRLITVKPIFVVVCDNSMLMSATVYNCRSLSLMPSNAITAMICGGL
jgi:hypothetical protein